MKTLKTDQVLQTLDGKDLQEGDTKITVGLLISNQLANSTSPNPHRAYQLAKQISTEKKVELTAESVVFIKEQITKSNLGALYVGQIIDILEESDSK